MWDDGRLLLALGLFAGGLYLLVNLLFCPFSVLQLGLAVACLLAAYWVKPRRRSLGEVADWLDVLDLLIELPVRAVLGLLRGVARLLRGDVGGLDL